MRSRILVLAAVSALAMGASARAAMTAADDASNYSGGGWGTSAPNNGSGFGAWASYVTNNGGPPYAGTYLDNSGKNIATSTYTWATYANTPGATLPGVDLVRPFLPAAGGYVDPSGLGTLYNQTFSMAMQSDGVGNAGQAVGFSLDNGQGAGATGNAELTFEYLGGISDNMTLTDNGGTNMVATVPLTYADINGGLLVSISVGSNPDGSNPYTLTVSPAPGNVAFSTPWVYSNYTNGAIQQIDMFDDNTSGNEYFNSLAISPESAPEPASLGLLAGSIVLLAARRRSV